MKGLKFDLETLADEGGGLPTYLALRGDMSDLGDTLLKLRALQAFDRGAARYAIQRTVRCAVRRSLEDLFDDLALNTDLVAQRVDSTSLLLDGPGVFGSADGRRKMDYGSCTFQIWAESLARLEAVRATLLDIVGEQLVRREMFTIDWHFSSGRMGLSSASFDEIADPEPYDEAYPTLLEPVSAFIARYLASRETVLILQGPPGTGKTRLVRAILAAMSARKADSAQVLYTADKRALESDEIFVDFITGSHDAFVIEDADHLLMARANGNVDLHRFLAVADGVVRAQGRKIIFTTNLPNVGDIDDALVRPGRCFATVRTRALERSEAESLLARLNGEYAPHDRTATELALPADVRSITLAALYRMAEPAT
jgi:ATPase family associated with various cellular activities (AAA)